MSSKKSRAQASLDEQSADLLAAAKIENATTEDAQRIMKLSAMSDEQEKEIARIQFFSSLPDKPFFKSGTKAIKKGLFPASILVSVAVSLLSLTLRWSLIWLAIPLAIIPTISYLLFKDGLGAHDKRENLTILKRYKNTLPFSVMMVATTAVTTVLNPTATGISYPFIKVLSLIVLVASLITTFVAIHKPKARASFLALKDKSFFELLAGGEMIYPGDGIIGYDVETYKPNRIPEKDRYLHFLMLGPTGSGKTAMSLTPMVWRDINNPDMGITVIEPKQDFAEKVYAMAKIAGREVVYFNPLLDNCPYFNPLYGAEADVIECMATTFGTFSADSSQFFRDANDALLRRGVKLLKRIKGNDATLIDLSILLHNTSNQGIRMVKDFERLPCKNEAEEQEKMEIVAWFLKDYYSGLSGERGATKTYENTSAVRTQVSKLNSNEYLRKVLNPPRGRGSDLDFADALERGIVVTVATVQGKLQELGKFLGYFIILQLQAAVFSRPGTEDTRKGNMLYIDEFQTYANASFENMLTQGRSYRVASHLATQTRDLIGANAGKESAKFISVVSTNARNKIIYPGGNFADASYYSREFGDRLETKIDRGISRQVSSPFSLGSYRAPNESIKEVEKLVPWFTPTEIMQYPFGRVVVSLIKNNSVSMPQLVELSFISYELKKEIDKRVDEFNQVHHLCTKAEQKQINDYDVSGEPQDASQIEDIDLDGLPGIEESIDFSFELDEHLGFKGVDPSADEEFIVVDDEEAFLGDDEMVGSRNGLIADDDLFVSGDDF